MSVTLKRHAVLEVIQVEVAMSMDEQGMDAYDSPVEIEGRVVRADVVVRLADGRETRAVATAWIDGAQSPLPTNNDRLTFIDGLVGIVIERVDGRPITTGLLDHIQVRAREE